MANKSSRFGSIDYTDAVIKAVRAGGNPSFADWRNTLIKQGWDADTAKSIKYDPVSGRFLSTLPGGKLTPDEAVIAEVGANPGKRLDAAADMRRAPHSGKLTPDDAVMAEAGANPGKRLGAVGLTRYLYPAAVSTVNQVKDALGPDAFKKILRSA